MHEMTRKAVLGCCAVWLMQCAPSVLAEGYDEPLQVALVVMPAVARSGDVVELRLVMTVNSPWHVYADTPGFDGQRPLRIEAKLPSAVEALGDWIWPQYESVFEGREAHIFRAGKHVFTRKVKVTGAPGPITFTVVLGYQACNPRFCGPFESVEVTSELEIAAGVEPVRNSGELIYATYDRRT